MTTNTSPLHGTKLWLFRAWLYLPLPLLLGWIEWSLVRAPGFFVGWPVLVCALIPLSAVAFLVKVWKLERNFRSIMPSQAEVKAYLPSILTITAFGILFNFIQHGFNLKGWLAMVIVALVVLIPFSRLFPLDRARRKELRQ